MKTVVDETGQTLIFVALGLTCVLGFVGLAVDIGTLFNARRVVQAAADSAAIAAASELNYSTNAGDLTTAGDAAAGQYNISASTAGTTVAIANPPTLGPHAAAAGTASPYVEAIITVSQPTFFMNLFGRHSMPVSARAVAFNGASAQACVYVMSPSADDAMDLQGSFDVSVPGCGIIVDSSASDALNFTGGGGSLTAQSVGVVGNASGKTGDSTPPPVPGIAPVGDPLASHNYPVYDCTSGSGASCTTSGSGTPSSVSCSDSTTTQPSSPSGAVCYGLGTTAGKHGGTTDSVSLIGNLNPGLYIINGDLSLGTVVGTGVTFYVTGNVTAANGTITLTAPTSGAYNGLAFYAPGDTGTLEFDFGSASGSVTGIIYAPEAELELHDSGGDKNGGLQLTTDLIVGTLYDQTATLSLTSYSKTVTTSPLTSVALVE